MIKDPNEFHKSLLLYVFILLVIGGISSCYLSLQHEKTEAVRSLETKTVCVKGIFSETCTTTQVPVNTVVTE